MKGDATDFKNYVLKNIEEATANVEACEYAGTAEATGVKNMLTGVKAYISELYTEWMIKGACMADCYICSDSGNCVAEKVINGEGSVYEGTKRVKKD